MKTEATRPTIGDLIAVAKRFEKSVVPRIGNYFVYDVHTGHTTGFVFKLSRPMQVETERYRKKKAHNRKSYRH